ncbi:hypothetical protein [Nocardia asteroides]|uniref:hypothetical protein n=1 Tax=Nocardia asteroides TaxID=1824 RepID=UPI001E334527|nr:hypothetical protein [Nocardia asteroides]UGT60891.1 hypothetical protein LTT61_27695 [Nocardia asteroides]
MAISGHFNHYDDPDEFWDDEPLRQPRGNQRPPVEADARPSGSAFASMMLDRGLLPIGIEFDARWQRHVAPHETGDELLRAYHFAVQTRMTALFAAERIPTPHEVSENAVPDQRTIMTILSETTTWEQFTTASSRIVTNERYEVHGGTLFRHGPATTVRADRDYLLSIEIQPLWAAAVEPHRVFDDVVRCADRIRALRPRFVVSGDYSRYSNADLEFRLDRHRQRLFDERMS